MAGFILEYKESFFFTLDEYIDAHKETGRNTLSV